MAAKYNVLDLVDFDDCAAILPPSTLASKAGVRSFTSFAWSINELPDQLMTDSRLLLNCILLKMRNFR